MVLLISERVTSLAPIVTRNLFTPISTKLTLPFLIDGRKERVQFDKITARVSRLCYGLDPEHVDAAAITQKVISGVYQGVSTILSVNHSPSLT